MITDALLRSGVAIVTFLTGLLPTWSPWPWFVDLGSTVNGLTSALSGLGVWINWPVVGGCVTAVLGSWVLFAQLKLLRVGIGHIPGVGGNG